jgi:YD repeat-containing protein
MLSTVTWPDNTTRQYVYEDTRFPTALTGVIDEAGVRYATYAYDDQGRAITSELTAGADRYQFQYQANGQTTVLTPDGGSSTYSFLKQNGVLLPTGVSAPCPLCGNTALSTSYDSNNNATSKTGYDGSTTSYTYDTLGRETQRIEGAGTANAKTTTTEWHPTLDVPAKVASPGKLETFGYDGAGNLVSYTTVATTDASGAAGLNATPTGDVTKTDWTFDSAGKLLSFVVGEATANPALVETAVAPPIPAQAGGGVGGVSSGNRDLDELIGTSRPMLGADALLSDFNKSVRKIGNILGVTQSSSEACEDDSRCESAKQKAASIYHNLTAKRFPQYLSGGTRGSDKTHYETIKAKQSGLRDAIRRVRLYCRPLPAELPEWERVANQDVPILF